MTSTIIKYRWIIIAVSLLAGAGSAILIPFSETDPEIRNYVPSTLGSRISTTRIEEEFGTQDMVIILFSDSTILTPEGMRQVKEVDRGLSRISGISKRISPFTMKVISGDDGAMTAERLIRTVPADMTEAEEIRERARENQTASEVVLSKDFTTAAITATIDNSLAETLILAKIDSVIASVSGPAVTETGGLPYIRKYIMKDVRKDAVFVVPAALIIMLFILRFTLGSWRKVAIPFTVVLLSTAISMGIIPLLGWKLSILSLLVPIILVAVANNYGIYLVARHEEISRERFDSRSGLIHRLTGSLNMPILFSGLTTVAGILGLLTHSIIPARQVGILSAAGVSAALLMSLTLIPALLYLSGRGSQASRSKSSGNVWSDVLLENLSGVIIRHHGKILAVSLVATLAIFSGVVFLKTDTNQEHMFPDRHPVRKASEAINRSFGGSQTISVMIAGDIKSPDLLKDMDMLTGKLKAHPGVGSVFSISAIVREMTKAVYDPSDSEYDRIPSSREGVAQLFELYYMSGEQGDFDQLVNPDNTKAHILVRLSDPSNKVIKELREMVETEKGNIRGEVTTGGYAIIMADFAKSVIMGQVLSLGFAVVTVFLLLALIFKSFKSGAIGIIPLGISILILFGFMGFAGIALDAATALLSSVMIGVGVDFTIQYIWCFNSEYQKLRDYRQATRSAIKTIGRSIIINAVTVMAGFGALIFSMFTSIRFFGYLVMISIGACLIGAILIIPSFLLQFQPHCIEKNLSDLKRIRNDKKPEFNPAPAPAFAAGGGSAAGGIRNSKQEP